MGYHDTPDNGQDLIDGRDVQRRIDDLESETAGAVRMPPLNPNSAVWPALLLATIERGWNSSRVESIMDSEFDWIIPNDPEDYASDDDADLSEEEAARMRADRAMEDARDVTEDMRELLILQSFADELDSNALQGETLIRETYFEDYAREFAEDIGAIGKDSQWPATCIDWEKAARELRMDYTGADFGGVTYYYRAG